jgi:hypothetical protein
MVPGKGGCSLGSRSQLLPELFQGWAEATHLVTLPTVCSGLTPPPLPKQELRAEEAYCQGLEVG